MGAVGVVEKLAGTAHVVRGGVKETLRVGSELLADDVVSTEPGSKLDIRFADDALVELGPASRVEVRDFVFDTPGEQNSFMLHMMEGVVRSVSGKVVEQSPEAFKLTSPMSTVGIRGTETMHLISDRYEVHVVTSLTFGHTVIIQLPDGRTVIISDALKGVILDPGDHGPLNLLDISPTFLDEYFRSLLSDNRLHDSPQDMYRLHGGELLAALGLDLTGHVTFIPVEHGLELVDILIDLDPELIRLLDVISGDSSPDVPDDGWVRGSNGNDYLAARSVASTLIGLMGDDTLVSYGGHDTLFGGHGSSDTLIKYGTMEEGNFFYGDGENLTGNDTVAMTVMRNAVCDDDRIEINGDMTGGEIYGDAKELDNCTAGSDVIVVAGTMSGGKIYADAETMTGGTPGNDSVTIGTLAGGEIHLGGGKNVLTVGSFAAGGDIVITANGESNTLAFSGAAAAMITDTGVTTPGRKGEVELPSSFNTFAGGTDTDFDAGARTRGVTLIGGSGVNTLTGGSGDDAVIVQTLIGGSTLIGGEGNDSIAVTVMNGGRIDGGAGADSINVGTMTRGVIQLGDGDSIRAGDVSGGTINYAANVLGSVGTLSGIGVLRGSAGNDAITVTTMNGGSINGRGGADSVHVGTLNGGTIDLDSRDVFTLGNAMHGGTVNLNGAAVNNLSLDGGTINYNGGSAGTIVSLSGTGAINGSAGTERIAINSMSGGSVDGGGGGDTIVMGVMTGGELYLHGGDSLSAADVSGGTIYYDGVVRDGVGTLSGSGALLGGAGADSIAVAIMNGGGISGGAGADSIHIGTLNDGTINLDSQDAFTLGNVMHGGTVNLNGAAVNSLALDGGTINYNGSSVGTITSLSGTGSINGSAGAEYITVTTIGGGSLDGGGGNDTVDVNIMSGGSLYLHGGDSLSAGTVSGGTVYFDGVIRDGVNGLIGTGALQGGAGNDSIAVSIMNGGSINGGAGADSLYVGTLSGGTITLDSQDSLTLGATMHGGTVNLNGAAVNSLSLDGGTIRYNGVSAGTITSLSGTGAVRGGAGADGINVGTMSGGTLNGGGGGDTISITSVSGGTVTLHGGDSVSFGAVSAGTIRYDGLVDGQVDTLSGGQLTGSAGRDSISVMTMTGGTLNGNGGGDDITIGSTFNGGDIYLHAGDNAYINRVTGTSSTSYGTVHYDGAPASFTRVNILGLHGQLVGTSATADSIRVNSMTDGTIDGHGGRDTIAIANSMSGGSIQAYGGDSLSVASMSAGTINYAGNVRGAVADLNTSGLLLGGGTNDRIAVGDMSGGTISTGAGTDTVVITGTMSGGDVYLEAGDSISAATVSGGTINYAGAVLGSIATMNGGVLLGTSGGADRITVANMSASGSTINGQGGNDTITITGAMSNGAVHLQGGDSLVANIVSGGSVYYDGWVAGQIQSLRGGTLTGTTGVSDFITVTGMTGGSIDGGGGGDYISVNGTMSGGVITVYGNDTLRIGHLTGTSSTNAGLVSFSGNIGGNMYGWSVDSLSGYAKLGGSTGADTLAVEAMSGGFLNGMGGGDSIKIGAMSGGEVAFYAGDTLSIGTLSGGTLHLTGPFSSGTIDTLTGSGILQGSMNPDNINLSSFVTSAVSGGVIYGDSDTLDGLITGAMDTIDFGIADSLAIYGDAYVMKNGATGGWDQILGSNLTGGAIYGDAYTMTGSAGGNDTINMTGVMNGGVISGDAYTMTGGSTGGNDNITLNSLTNSARVYGDAAGTLGAGCSGGNDNIIASAVSSFVHIAGDADTVNGAGGDDTIVISGAMNSGCIISGDAMLTLSGTGGGDLIQVSSMTGGAIYGDAQTLTGRGGSDTIQVTGVMSGGYIYGDGGDAASRFNPATHALVPGDTINVNTMQGGYIFGGAGDDTILLTSFMGGRIDAGGGDDMISIVNVAGTGGSIDFGTNAVRGNDSVYLSSVTGTQNISVDFFDSQPGSKLYVDGITGGGGTQGVDWGVTGTTLWCTDGTNRLNITFNFLNDSVLNLVNNGDIIV